MVHHPVSSGSQGLRFLACAIRDVRWRKKWSGRWDSNPRRSAWKADILAAELRPHIGGSGRDRTGVVSLKRRVHKSVSATDPNGRSVVKEHGGRGRNRTGSTSVLETDRLPQPHAHFFTHARNRVSIHERDIHWSAALKEDADDARSIAELTHHSPSLSRPDRTPSIGFSKSGGPASLPSRYARISRS